MKNLYTALIAAQQSAQAVEKSSSNTFHRYKYASAEAVIAEARAALGGAGLSLLTTCAEIRGHLLETRYLLVHTSGECMEVLSQMAIVEDKGRPLDKAVTTAKTYDLGYTLRGLLLLPRVEEGTEVDARDNDKDQPVRTKTVAMHAVTYDTGEVIKQLADKISDASTVAILEAVALQVRKANLGEEAKLYLTKKYREKKAELTSLRSA